MSSSILEGIESTMSPSRVCVLQKRIGTLISNNQDDQPPPSFCFLLISDNMICMRVRAIKRQEKPNHMAQNRQQNKHNTSHLSRLLHSFESNYHCTRLIPTLLYMQGRKFPILSSKNPLINNLITTATTADIPLSLSNKHICIHTHTHNLPSNSTICPRANW